MLRVLVGRNWAAGRALLVPCTSLGAANALPHWGPFPCIETTAKVCWLLLGGVAMCCPAERTWICIGTDSGNKACHQKLYIA